MQHLRNYVRICLHRAFLVELLALLCNDAGETCAYVARHLAEQGQILEACLRLGEAEGYARCIQL